MFIKNGDSHPITIVEPKITDKIVMDDKNTKKKFDKVIKEIADKNAIKPVIVIEKEINE